MANERHRIYKDGKLVAHIDEVGDGQYYNYVVDGKIIEQIIPRAGNKWYDVERNGKKIREIQTDPTTWNK
jgi:hypothetical protein